MHEDLFRQRGMKKTHSDQENESMCAKIVVRPCTNYLPVGMQEEEEEEEEANGISPLQKCNDI